VAILGRVAPVLEVLRTAATVEPEIAELRPREKDPRYVVHAAAAEALVGKPGAAPDLTASQVADVLFGLLSPELYLVFVRDRGWQAEVWEDWAFTTLRAQLCR
jgi:hypothetical protein